MPLKISMAALFVLMTSSKLRSSGPWEAWVLGFSGASGDLSACKIEAVILVQLCSLPLLLSPSPLSMLLMLVLAVLAVPSPPLPLLLLLLVPLAPLAPSPVNVATVSRLVSGCVPSVWLVVSVEVVRVGK